MAQKSKTKEQPKSENKKKKRLVLLDAHAILHRAYHALPDFTTPQGEPSGALYGLATMLFKIADELKPDYIIACYDLPEPTHRHVAFADYKATRAKTDDALVAQLISSRKVFDALSVPYYEKAGFEADDLLGTIAEETKKNQDLEVIIASGDMDTLQLVEGERVRVYTLKKGIKETILYDEKGVEERFGFNPTLIPDYKGLRGDPSDNIPGIVGIGEKTATELIARFGSLEALYRTLKKDRKKFEAAGVKERMIGLLEEHEDEALFSKELATIRRDVPITFTLPEQEWRESVIVEKALALCTELGFRSLYARVKSVFGKVEDKSEEKKEGESAATLFSGESQEAAPTLDEAAVTETAIALWLIHSETTNPSLDDILNYTPKASFADAHEKIMHDLHEAGLDGVFEKIEKPLIPVVEAMEKRGVRIDTHHLAQLSKEYHVELAKLEERIWSAAGGQFNINSPKQLGETLFNKLNLSVKNQKRTSTGAKSTRESELEKLKDEHEIVRDILEYRELQKLLSTYIDNIPTMIGSDGRLHAHFSQTGTTTGRMSSQSPNLQNIPIRTPLGRAIRNGFVADEGYTLVSFDYSQIELRIAAFLSGDEKLIEIFKGGGDVHRAVAAEVFAVPPELVDDEMRRRAKVINFGILYGMGVNALQQTLGTGRSEAQRFLSDYFKQFFGIRHYVEGVKSAVAHTGYTETFFGRRRYFDGIRSPLPYIKAQAERMAINAPIQGTQADIIKIAMARIDTYLQKEHLLDDCRLLLQVHDELVYEIRTSKKAALIPEVKKIMESVMTLDETKGITLIAEAKEGKNWGEMERVG